MNQKTVNFRDTIMHNNEEELKEFIKINGKPPKPISPFIFYDPERKREENENGRDSNNG